VVTWKTQTKTDVPLSQLAEQGFAQELIQDSGGTDAGKTAVLKYGPDIVHTTSPLNLILPLAVVYSTN
jgi:hypothetical protein